MNFFEKRCVCVYMCVLLFVISKFEWNYPEIPSGEHFPCFESICFEWISNTGSCIHWGYELCFQIMKKHVWVISITINIIYSIFHHTLSILKRTLYLRSHSCVWLILWNLVFLWKYPKYFFLHFLQWWILMWMLGLHFDNQFLLHGLSHSSM